MESALRELSGHWPEIPGFAITLRRGGEIVADAATGFADPDTGEQLTTGHEFRSASTTKTFTAAAILRACEAGTLTLDDLVGRSLPAGSAETVGRAYDLHAITLRHLLTHTSGISDFQDDPRHRDQVVEQPRRVWAVEEQLAAIGDTLPLGPPGSPFSYSDSNFVLLGQVIANLHGGDWAKGLRAELPVLDDLRHTYLEWLETPPDVLPRAEQFVRHGEIDFRASEIHASMDLFGGGGLMTTTGDLARFAELLSSGAVFRRPETLTLMLAPTGAPYGLGVRELPGGWRGHGGAWGSLLAFHPESGRSVGLVATRAPGSGPGPAPVDVLLALEEAGALRGVRRGPSGRGGEP